MYFLRQLVEKDKDMYNLHCLNKIKDTNEISKHCACSFPAFRRIFIREILYLSFVNFTENLSRAL